MEADPNKEMEADDKASEIIIPSKDYKKFLKYTNFYEAEIKEFAKEQGIHYGLVAGRLAHDEYIDFKDITKLRIKYDWVA